MDLWPVEDSISGGLSDSTETWVKEVSQTDGFGGGVRGVGHSKKRRKEVTQVES